MAKEGQRVNEAGPRKHGVRHKCDRLFGVVQKRISLRSTFVPVNRRHYDRSGHTIGEHGFNRRLEKIKNDHSLFVVVHKAVGFGEKVTKELMHLFHLSRPVCESGVRSVFLM